MRTAALALTALTLALLAMSCASTGGTIQDEALIECRSRADAMFKARYTPRWEAGVDRCMEDREKQ